MGDKEVFMLMRYPVSIGPLNECDLDEMFRVIRRDSIMADKDCTFGASVTCFNGATPVSSPPAASAARSNVSALVNKFEGTDGVRADLRSSSLRRRFSPLSSLGSSTSASSMEITKGFYLKSAPAYGKAGSDELNPAIVVEMYTNNIAHLDDDFVDAACSCISSAIQCHLLTQRSLDLSIHFLISTPNRVLSRKLTCCPNDL